VSESWNAWLHLYAVANSVMLQVYLRHDFYAIIIKIRHKLHIASGSVPPPSPQKKTLGARLISPRVDMTACDQSWLCESGFDFVN